ncbi:hypothetical protein NQ318_022278 [Aromia moschata]|uniref:Serine/threonine-protein phosphatase n=1 Tax=Aromia moschata TaxID=1265417 RepID=A0AAV8Z4F1_9CUCU|nr:hypothetical protein NQ318_022278 [Aromia moschata]
MAMFKSSADLCDAVSVAVYCGNDTTMMLTVDNTNEHWIPSTRVPSGQSWFKAITKELQDGPAPQALGTRSRDGTSFQYRGKLRWVTEADLSKLSSTLGLKSPELIELFNLFKKTTPGADYVHPEDYIFRHNFAESSDEILVTGKGNSYYQLVDASGIDKLAQENLLKEFIYSIFPASYMGFKDFSKFVLELGWTKENVSYLFKAADLTNRNGLSFREFLFLLAAADPNTVHGGAAAEIRCKYMFKCWSATFDVRGTKNEEPLPLKSPLRKSPSTPSPLQRYYDRDRDNMLKPDEFKSIIFDLRKVKKLALDANSVAKDASEVYKHDKKLAMGIGETSNINLMTFLKGIADLKIRGTSSILRSSVGIIKYLKDLSRRRLPLVMADRRQRVSDFPKNIIHWYKKKNLDVRGKMTAPSMRANFNYEVAVHTVKIQKSGEAINIDEMKTLKEAVSLTTLKQPYNEQSRKVSVDIFSQRSVSNELLKGLRYLTSINKIQDVKASYTWGQLNSSAYARNLIIVCQQVRDILRLEKRLLEINSPVYIMGNMNLRRAVIFSVAVARRLELRRQSCGFSLYNATGSNMSASRGAVSSCDFHGNVADLLYFEKILWHIGPGLCPCNLLFLGDYVDRGAYSIEVMSYLMAYKLQFPKKVNLLRGNHEIRDVQKMFTFHKECLLKFGEKLGNEVWAALFCCHGGVPPPWLCPVISAINDIPVPLNQPDTQSSLAWELMWNDPVRPKAMNDKLTMELLANEGFAVNQRRGTAHVFNVEALERFLKANQLTHLVRAHEVAQAGFQVQQKGKLLTVFSSSKYCGGGNDAACVMVDQEKLRILRLATD